MELKNGKRTDSWTNEEIQHLLDNRDKHPNDLSVELQRTVNAVRMKRHILGIRFNNVKHVEWLDDEIEFLTSNYGYITDQDIATDTGKSRGAVYRKATELGLRKSLTRRYESDNLPKRFKVFKKQAIDYIKGDEMALDPFEFEHYMLMLEKYITNERKGSE